MHRIEVSLKVDLSVIVTLKRDCHHNQDENVYDLHDIIINTKDANHILKPSVVTPSLSRNGIILKLVVVILYSLPHLLQLEDLLLIVLLMLRLLCSLLILLILLILHPLEDARPIRDPTIAFLENIIPDVFLLDAEIILVLSSKIENVINIVKFIVGLTHMLLEAL